MNSHERDLIVTDRNGIYDKLSRVLTDYEEGACDAEDLYDMLVEIQTAWEDTITCQLEESNGSPTMQM